MTDDERERALTLILALAISVIAAALWAGWADGAPVPPPRARPAPAMLVPRDAIILGSYRAHFCPSGAYRAGHIDGDQWVWVGSWRVVGKTLIIREVRADSPDSTMELRFHWRSGRWEAPGGQRLEVRR